MDRPPGSRTQVQIWSLEADQRRSRSDHLVTEEPLEIRVVDPPRTLAITMRTPSVADFELTAGFLYGEGLIQHRSDLKQLSYCTDPVVDGEQRYNIINVRLREGLPIDWAGLERHFYTSSACGVCGKTNLESLRQRGHPPISSGPSIAPTTLYQLPIKLREAQKLFTTTGGLHAAALFDGKGNLLKVREDVGRHNALDKLIGSAFLAGELPLGDRIVMVSGRSSYEILQKCLAAGVSFICSVSAPSSLAVSLAQEFGITLVGFLRNQTCNVYTGIERIQENASNQPRESDNRKKIS